MTRTEALIHLAGCGFIGSSSFPADVNTRANRACNFLWALENVARGVGRPLQFDPEPRDVEPGDLGHDGEPLDGPPAHWIQVTNHAHELVIDEPIDQLDGRGDFPIPAGAFLRVFRSGEGE